MRKIISSLFLLVFGATAFAQETFPINGVRDLRTGVYAFTNATIIQNEKTKIEKAAKAAGAATADWNDESKVLNVTYSATKSNNKKIQQKVADAGYDTQDLRTTDAAFNKLPGCCKYDRKPQQ